jgi:tetratricopeptide (TPR) repeat protein
VLDWYRYATAVAALQEWRGSRTAEPAELPPPPAAGPVPRFDGNGAAALAWLDEHGPVLRAATDAALAAGAADHASRLADDLADYLARRGRWHDMADVAEVGLRAGRAADRAAESRALYRLGIARAGLRDAEGAVVCYLRALSLDAARHDRRGQVANLTNLAMVCHDQERLGDALEYYRQALDLVSGLGCPRIEANIRNGLADALVALGRHAEALTECERAERAVAAADPGGTDPLLIAAILDTQASAQLGLGRRADAVGCYRRSLRALAGRDLPHFEALILLNLGRAVRADHPDEARARLERALALLTGLDDPVAAEVRAELGGLANLTAS